MQEKTSFTYIDRNRCIIFKHHNTHNCHITCPLMIQILDINHSSSINENGDRKKKKIIVKHCKL